MSNSLPTDHQPKPIDELELDLLRQEYFFLQNTIEDYNKQIWVIKALGITGTGAILALMLQQKTNATPARSLLLVLLFLYSFGYQKVNGNTFSMASIPAQLKLSQYLAIATVCPVLKSMLDGAITSNAHLRILLNIAVMFGMVY